jgi:hypothetical protein
MVLTPLFDIPADARLFNIRQIGGARRRSDPASSTRHPDLADLCDRVRRSVEDEPLLP